VSAIWHDHGQPSFLGIAPRFSFFDLAEVHQEAPASYQAVMEDVRLRERMLGVDWFRHNAALAHVFWLRKRPWWLV
jgi:hypothetical protein